MSAQNSKSPTTSSRLNKKVTSVDADSRVSKTNHLPQTVSPKKEKFNLKKSFQKLFPKTWQKVVFFVVIGLILLLSILGVISASYLNKVKVIQAHGEVLATDAKNLLNDFSTQNFPQAKVNLEKTRLSYENMKVAYDSLSSLKNIPTYGQFLKDGDKLLLAGDSALNATEKLIEAVLPYSDLLGFSEGEENAEGSTAEDRVVKIIETLSYVTPELDAISADLNQMQQAIEEINPKNYPEKLDKLFLFNVLSIVKPQLKEYREFNLKETVTDVIALADQATTTFADYRPVIEKLPEIMGSQERMKYLVLFQNDNELRPTGGFLTAYSIIVIENGKIQPETSDDIYELDKLFTKQISIPEKLGKYLTTEKTWHLRDMNIDPDFKNSMDIFLENYRTLKIADENLSGIVAIDTKVLTDLIDILGPVEVPGYGTFSTEPDTKYTDAPQVVVALSEIITRPTNYIREDRKGVLGPMMSSLLNKAYSAPKELMPELFQTMIADLEGRHIQAYLFNEEHQAAIETINAAGRMVAPEPGQNDFLAVVDANLGGAKSNLFISYEVNQQIDIPENGELYKKVDITYKNSRPGDNCNLEAGLLCLNSTNNDWQRIYLPEGSQLIKAQGYKNEPEVYSENGFTVIDGFFSLDPNKTAKVVLEYTVPYNDPEEYRLNIWKQGGVDIIPHLIDVNGNQEQIDVVKDTLYQTTFN